MNNLMKKSLAALMALMMLLSVANFAVFAVEEPPATGHEGNHTFNDAADVAEEPATCTTAGHGKGWTCTIPGCGYVMYEVGKEVLPPLGHDGVLVSAEEQGCGKAGHTAYYRCSRCGKLGDDKACTIETTEAAHALPALEHAWGEWVVTKTAKTCKEQSEKQRTCSRCGKMELEKFGSVEHTPKNVPEVPATCTEAGTTAGKVCASCGAVLEGCDPIPASGHSWGEGVTTEPTCETPGKTTYTCANCGKTRDENVKPALDHDYVDDPEVTANCKREGLTAGRHCARCKKVFIKQEPIPKTDHDWEIIPAVSPTCTEPGCTEGAKCKVCDYVRSVSEELPPNGHKFTTEVITKATCEGNGMLKKYCTECSEMEMEVVPATGHNLSDWIYDDNFACDVGGERYKVCANCGGIFEREQVDPKGHDWSKEWTIDTEATCTSKGYKSHHCTVCDKKNDITTIPKQAHNYRDKVTKATAKRDGQIKGFCTVCGQERLITIRQVGAFTQTKTSYVYNGEVKRPGVAVKDVDGKKLKKDVDYTVTYSTYNSKKVGSYTVTITLIGNYAGTKVLKYKIVLGTPKTLKAKADAKKQTVSLTCSTVKGAQQYIFYYCTKANGSYKKLVTSKKPSAVVKTLKPGTYYIKVRTKVTLKDGSTYMGAPTAAVKVKLAKPPVTKTTKK